MKSKYRSSRRAVFNLTVHIVFVTKYRRQVINAEMMAELSRVFESVLKSWDSELIEFNGESDHVHLLISYPPHKLLSSLIANLKATSSKAMWRKFESIVSEVYSKRVFWTGAYFVASCGGVTIDVLKRYVQQQDCPSRNILPGFHEGLSGEFSSPVHTPRPVAKSEGIQPEER